MRPLNRNYLFLALAFGALAAAPGRAAEGDSCWPYRMLAVGGKVAGQAGKVTIYPVVFGVKLLAWKDFHPGVGFVTRVRRIVSEDKLAIAGYLFTTLVLAPLADPTASGPNLQPNTVDIDFYFTYDDEAQRDEDPERPWRSRFKRLQRWVGGGGSTATAKVHLGRDNLMNPDSQDIPMSEGVISLIKTLRELKAQGKKVRNLRIMGHGNAGYIGGKGQESINTFWLRNYEKELKELAAEVLTPDSRVDYFGCNVGAGDDGKQLVDETQRILGLKDGSVRATSQYQLTIGAPLGSRTLDVVTPTRNLNGLLQLYYRFEGTKERSQSPSRPGSKKDDE